MKTRILTSIPLLAWLLLTSTIAAAELGHKAIGTDGVLFELRVGTLGEIFGETDDQLSQHSCLALDITHPDGAAVTKLVPGTEDSRLELNPRLTHRTKSGGVILLWESAGFGEEQRELRFVVHDEDFGEIAAAMRDELPASMPKSPLIASTIDSFDLLLDDAVLSTSRTIVHVVWQADSSTWYTPLLFVEGFYVGWNDSFRLDASFVSGSSGEDEPPEETPAAVGDALKLGVTSDETSIVVAFANTTAGRIGALEIGVLPLELALLSDEIRTAITENGELLDDLDAVQFGGEIRAEIIIVGSTLNLNQDVVGFVADHVADWLVDTLSSTDEPPDLEALGEAGRGLAIELTTSLFGETPQASQDEDPGDDLIEIVIGGECEAPGDGQPAQILDISVQSEIDLPNLGTAEIDDLEIMTSHDGARLLLAWTETPSGEEIPIVHFVQTEGAGTWSPIVAIRSTSETSLSEIFGLLRERLH